MVHQKYLSIIGSSYSNTHNSLKVRSARKFAFYLLILLNILSISLILYFEFVHSENSLFYINWILNFFAGFAVFIGIYIYFKKILKGIEGKTYTSLTIGLLLFFLGEITWTYYQILLNIEIPFPSLADLFWILGYIFIGYHIYGTYKFWKHNKKIDNRHVIIISILICMLSSFMIYTTISESYSNIKNELISTSISITYVVLDSVLAIPAIAIVWSLRSGHPFFTHWLLISFFILFNSVADFGFGYTYIISVDVEEAERFEWIWDILFNASYISIAIALLWYQKIIRLTNDNINNVIQQKKNLFQKLWDDTSKYNHNIENFDSSNYNHNTQEHVFMHNFKNDYEVLKYLKEVDKNLTSNSLIWYNPNISKMINEKYFLEFISSLNNKINIKTRILFPLEYKKDIDKNLLNRIEYLCSNQSNLYDIMFFIFDTKLLLLLEYDRKKDKKFITYSNKEQLILTYLSIFENNWNLALLQEQQL